MANSENVNKAYAAIGSLLASGVKKLTVEKVREASGLARQTFYQNDKDWQEIRAVIKGKPSSRVKLVQVEIKQKSESARKLDALFGRIETMEQEVTRLEQTASQVYKDLIDEIQRWFYKASETPKKSAAVARYIEELNGMREELERVNAENRLLKAQSGAQESVRILSHKKIIELNVLAKPGDLFNEFLRQYQSLVPTSAVAASVRAIYILCGLPFSGKTTWIKNHKPTSPGLHIYIDSCAHQADIRGFIANQIASANVETHCVWMRRNIQVCLERSSIAYVGAASVSKKLEIESVAANFEPPSLVEPFDSVILGSKNDE